LLFKLGANVADDYLYELAQINILALYYWMQIFFKTSKL